MHSGFADQSLTTWARPHKVLKLYQISRSMSSGISLNHEIFCIKINKKTQAQGTGELVCFLEVYLSGNAHGIFTSEASLAKTVAVRITCTAGFKHSLGTDKCQ